MGSGNGLVPSGSKPLSEPMLTLGHNEFTHEAAFSFSGPLWGESIGEALLVLCQWNPLVRPYWWGMHYWPLWRESTLKRKCLHFDEIFNTGCTGSCQNDNFQCSQWLKFCQNDDIFVSVHQSLLFAVIKSLLLAWTNCSTNRWAASDLQCCSCDVNVMNGIPPSKKPLFRFQKLILKPIIVIASKTHTTKNVLRGVL